MNRVEIIARRVTVAAIALSALLLVLDAIAGIIRTWGT